MAKKADLNKPKTSQPSNDSGCPSTSISSPEKTLLSKPSNQNQKIKNVERFMAEKINVNAIKTPAPFIFEG